MCFVVNPIRVHSHLNQLLFHYHLLIQLKQVLQAFFFVGGEGFGAIEAVDG